MSDTDSFIDEVTEEVRRDKLFALFRRYGWIGLVAILALVGSTAWKEFQLARSQADAAAFGDAMRGALATGTAADRDAALAQIPASGGQDVIRALAQASDPLAAREQALAALDGVIARDDVDPVYRDLAVLRRVLILGSDLPATDRDAALTEIGAIGRPYAPLARELQALALLQSGQTEAAIAAFNALIGDNATPSGLRQRASALVTALGGAPVEPAAAVAPSDVSGG